MVRVFIVDDELIMRQGLRYMFEWEKEGYEIVGEAANGNDALREIEKTEPHIIISDIVMPLMDGLDFTDVVHRMYPRIQIIILSGYDNFEYVRHTLMGGVVDYILKPTLSPEDLRAVLARAVARIPGLEVRTQPNQPSIERVIEKYLIGQTSHIDRPVFESCFTRPNLCIYAVSLQHSCGREVYELVYGKVRRELQTLENIDKTIVTMRENQICGILGYELPQRSMLRMSIEKLNAQLSLMYEHVFGILSRSFGDVEELYRVYQEDIAANCEQGFYLEDKNLLLVDRERLERGREPYRFDFSLYNRYLMGMQYEEAAGLLEAYVYDALASRMDAYRMKNQIKNMVYIFLESLSISDEEKENYRYDFFRRIDESHYRHEYQSAISGVLQKLREFFSDSSGLRNERMSQILRYIDENYRQELSLDILAKEFGFNYHYLSSYFNQKMNESFSDYLNRVRIEKACELLEDSDLSVSEVSSLVGYSEHSYFCRVFKKYVGQTPSVWRRGR